MRTVLRIILSNYFISLVLLLLILVFYKPIKPFSAKISSKPSDSWRSTALFDLDNDAKEERVVIEHHDESYGSISVYDQNERLISLFNFSFIPKFDSRENIIFDDFNQNGHKEIVLFTRKSDSLFLSRIEFLYGVSEKPLIYNTFLDIIKPIAGKHQYNKTIKKADFENDGQQEIVISITAGHSILPRFFYIFNGAQNTLIKSPIRASSVSDFKVVDIDNDSIKELVVSTYASCNVDIEFYADFIPKDKADSNLIKEKDAMVRTTDCKSWLLVYDSELKYKFNPVSYGEWTGILTVQPFKYNGVSTLLALYTNVMDSLGMPKVLLFDLQGKLLKDISLSFENIDHQDVKLSTYQINNQTFLTVLNHEKQGYTIDSLFNFKYVELSQSNQENINYIESKSIDQTIGITVENNRLMLYDQDLDVLQSFPLIGINSGIAFSTISSIDQASELIVVNLGSAMVELVIKKDELYKFRFLLWPLLYIIIWLIVYYLQKISSIRAIKEKKRLQKIVDLRTKEIEEQKNSLLKLTEDLKERNDKVYQQNLELQRRQGEIELLYERVTSSIAYGKGIKTAFLPSQERIEQLFPDAFIYFRPKNVVGGDFYWIHQIENKKIFVLGDASGEGISGGFLSFLAISVLNDLKMTTETTASDMLSSVNATLFKYLSDYLKNPKDGIEMAVLMVENISETERSIQFASANVAMHYLPSDMVIGYKLCLVNDYSIRADFDRQVFKNIDLVLPSESMIYMATQGMLSQEGGENQEAFGKSQFRINLQRISVLPIKEQSRILIEKFEKWQGTNDQNDDVLCVGLKI